MIPRGEAARDHRILLLAPTRKDGATTASLLEDAGLSVTSCSAFDGLIGELTDGAGVVILPEETMTPTHTARLAAVVRAQPPWLDLPILVLAHAGAESVATSAAVKWLGNVTILERPLRVPTLLSAVRTALRARQRLSNPRAPCHRARDEESLRLADQRKDEFLATLGQELRNPLAPLFVGHASAAPWRAGRPACGPRARGDGTSDHAPGTPRRRPARSVTHHAWLD
jgi:signal transduction histidine kinase